MARANRTSDPDRGSTHKVLSVAFRIVQIACAAIVLGVLGEFSHRTNNNGNNVDKRIIYTMALAGISIVYALLCMVPFKMQFLAFPMDFILFVMWLTAFCLLETRGGIYTCTSSWYRNYWGPNWVGFRYNRFGVVQVSGDGCAEWRTALAFSFNAMFAHLLSVILGIYVWHHYFKKSTGGAQGINRHEKKLSQG